MALVGDELEGWKHAYRVLDAPLSASPATIKQSYRKLMKRWHPDLFASGSAGQVEASNMTRIINEAYASIGRAPLRYYAEPRTPTPQAPARAGHAVYAGVPQSQRTAWRAEPARASEARSAGRNGDDPYPNADRIEFWVRLIMGLGFGLFFGLVASLEVYVHVGTDLWIPIAIAVGVTAAVTVGSVKQGDKFWHSFFNNWLEWQ